MMIKSSYWALSHLYITWAETKRILGAVLMEFVSKKFGCPRLSMMIANPELYPSILSLEAKIDGKHSSKSRQQCKTIKFRDECEGKV
ncbi:hypothetical protein QVD17_22566 [Tagetes erecta]|uniref:Uncharacterized protein n=1 Tax=Tagetes erecta TaxID=13708 RepID=A0AAD8NU32_TARER|nr:hypothetical protein QVD17_22566 [Tagetes erecta]